MVFISETKDYIILKRIRKITLFILLIMMLTLLFLISYFVTCNSSSVSCNPSELLNDFVESVNNNNTKKVINLTNINCDNVKNSKCISINNESLTNKINTSNLSKINTSGSHIVVQTSDYVIYNITFDTINKTGEQGKKTVPVMFVKNNEKWFIDYSSVLSIFE